MSLIYENCFLCIGNAWQNNRPCRTKGDIIALAVVACDSSGEHFELRSMDEKGEEVELKRGGRYRSRAHFKSEKRKQRKKWKKRKQKLQRQELQNAPGKDDAPGIPIVRGEEKPLTRGSLMVSLARKRSEGRGAQGKEEGHAPPPKKKRSEIKPSVAPVRTIPKRVPKPTVSAAASHNTVTAVQEINPDLLIPQENAASVGSGTFGQCYLATYRDQYSVLVKEMKEHDNSDVERRRAKREVLREANLLLSVGDHEGFPHLFGVCSKNSPYRLILQFHNVGNQSITMSKASSEMDLDLDARLAILKSLCQTLSHLHSRGFLHNDLKGNNVVLEQFGDGRYRPIVIDFGKSVRIEKARLGKPKVNPERAARQYPHIAPEVLRGSRQTVASDVYSFGQLVHSFTGDCTFKDKFLIVIEKCAHANPRHRLSLDEVMGIFETKM